MRAMHNLDVMLAWHYSVDMKRQTRIAEEGKALNFQNHFCPHSHLWS